MSFLKQLLNPFVEFDPDKKPDPVKQVVLPPVPKVADEPVHHPLISEDEKVMVSATISQSDPNPSGPLPEHVQYFEQLIDKANAENPVFKGADFKEFVDAKVDIDDIVDENLKYSTALNIFKNSGLTKEKLLSTGQEYLNVIGRDLNAFLTAHSQQYKKELHQKELDLKKKAEELQLLTQRMNVLKTEINQITRDINQSQHTLNTSKKSFLLAGEIKQNEIQTELQKIGKYFD
jgi:hypothetical protein